MRAIKHLYRQHKSDPFSWGTCDCLTWVADCALVMTGRDPASDLRGRYDSETSAKRVMAEHGWNNMADVAASMHEEIPVAQARTGDWAWIPDGDTLGVVVNHMICARTKDRGLGQVPLTRAVKAYRVT